MRAFGHSVVTCCNMLRHVGSGFWLKFENGQIFHATFVDVAWCWSRLARFVQQCCAWACALVRFSTSNMSQHVATEGGQTGVQHVAPSNVAICCFQMLRSFGRSLQMLGQQCSDMLLWGVAVVWPGLKNHTYKIGYLLDCVSLQIFLPSFFTVDVKPVGHSLTHFTFPIILFCSALYPDEQFAQLTGLWGWQSSQCFAAQPK